MLQNTSCIFLPGTMCDERVWLPLWTQLDIKQRSYVPLQWAQTLNDMLALTQDRIDQAPHVSKISLIGFSMGAYIAALSALNTNNQAKIANLVLIAYDPFGLSEQENQARNDMLSITAKHAKTKINSSQRLAKYFTAAELKQTTLTKVVSDMHEDLGSATLIAQINACTPRQNIASALAKTPIKQTIIGSEHDHIAQSERLNQYANSAKQAKYYEIAQTSHMSIMTKPNEIADILEQL